MYFMGGSVDGSWCPGLCWWHTPCCTHQPPVPNLNGLPADQVKSALENHKLLLDQWHESLNETFDLLITKTAVPIATLLLGYLFGRSKGAS